MKRLFLLPLLAGSALAASASTTVTLDGKEFTADTLFHAKVGPGTTQTSLNLTGPVTLKVHYLTIDRNTPGVSIRAVSGTDKLAGKECTSAMAKRHSTETTHYFAGSNGDFYFTGGSATNGSGIAGTPVCAMTVDGEVMRTSNSSYQFSVDAEGIARICRLNYQKGTATAGDVTVNFAAVNNDAVNNAVTLYTSKFWGSSNQPGLADQCYEVAAMPAEGETFRAGEKWKIVVSSEPGRTGDMAVPDGGFVLLGRGTAQDFVAGLKPGDVVTLDNLTLTPEGEAIKPSIVISGNPKNVGGGANLHSEAERGDATQRHPRTGIGFSADGSRLVMMVIDGRSAGSVGVTTGELGDMLIFAGCDEGLNVDGGGSSTLYTEALGVRNTCSDGSERAVANAIYAVLEAPADDKVAEIAFHDYQPSLPQWGVYTPQVMAFNAAGLCIDPDFKDYTLSCAPDLGEVSEDGHTLSITGTGMHALTATVGDATVTMPIKIVDATGVELVRDKVTIDRTHPCEIKLTSTVGYKKMPLNARAFSWTSADAEIAAVSEEGVITAGVNGTTTVTGVLNDTELVQNVEVRHPEHMELPVTSLYDPTSWKLSKQGLSEAIVKAEGEGFVVNYTVSSARGTKLTLSSGAHLYGCPETLKMKIAPTPARLRNIVLTLRCALSKDKVNVTLEEPDLTEGLEYTIDLKDYFDTTDNGIWPVELYTIAYGISDANGESREINTEILATTYAYGLGIDDAVTGSESGAAGVTVADGHAVLEREARSIVLTDMAGRVIGRSSGRKIQLPEGHGVAVIIADGLAAKIMY